MFKSNFNVISKVLDNNLENLERYLNRMNVNLDIKPLVVKMKENSDWIEVFEDSLLKKIVLSLSKIEGSLEIEIEEWEDLEFKYFDLPKKLFFLQMSNSWEYKPSARMIVNALSSVEDSEVKNNKCVINFTKDEMADSVIYLMKGMAYYRLRQRINIISRLQIFYSEDTEMFSNWREILNPSELEKIIGRDIDSSDLIDIDDLIDLYKVMNNMQDFIIPILVFNGVKLSRSNEQDEVRYLKKNDLAINLLTVSGRSGAKERVIELDSEISEMIRETSLRDYVVNERRGKNVVLDLKDTDYILRAALPARFKKIDEDEDILSFRGAWGRMLTCKEHMEALAPEFSFSAKKVELSGKIHFINKFMEDNEMELYDAIRATLKRFGDWVHLDGGNEVSYPPNTQKVNRLKHLWSVYN